MKSERKSPYRRGADDGFFFGIYLSAMFFASVYSLDAPLLGVISFLMVLAVPFIIYRFLRRTYVEEYGTTLLSALWMQGIMIFLCGALICGAVSLIYLKWINPSFIVDQMRTVIDIYSGSGWESGEEMADMMQRIIDNNLVPTSISIVMEMIWLSVFSGSLLSLLMSLLVRARAVPDNKRI